MNEFCFKFWDKYSETIEMTFCSLEFPKLLLVMFNSIRLKYFYCILGIEDMFHHKMATSDESPSYVFVNNLCGCKMYPKSADRKIKNVRLKWFNIKGNCLINLMTKDK